MRPRCKDCGARTITACPSCSNPIEGVGENRWMANSGPYSPPRYCDQCCGPFPWTETALLAASKSVDDSDTLDPDEKNSLKETFPDLVADTPSTPLAATRFQRLISRIVSSPFSTVDLLPAFGLSPWALDQSIPCRKSYHTEFGPSRQEAPCRFSFLKTRPASCPAPETGSTH
jgi:hypothetical protein